MTAIRQGFMLGLGLQFEDGVSWAAETGFEFVELLLDGPYARERVNNVETKRAQLERQAIDLVVHLPFTADIGSPFSPVRTGAVEECRRGMELATDLGADRVVFHPDSDAWELGWTDSDCLAFVHESLDELVPTAHELGLEPCLENVISGYYDVQTFPELLTAYPAASMTFDTSHAYLAGMDERTMGSFIEQYADRIGHLHLVDTRGATDEHLPVGMGTIEFEPIIDALASVDWAGTATHEVGTEDLPTIELSKRHVDRLLSSA